MTNTRFMVNDPKATFDAHLFRRNAVEDAGGADESRADRPVMSLCNRATSYGPFHAATVDEIRSSLPDHDGSVCGACMTLFRKRDTDGESATDDGGDGDADDAATEQVLTAAGTPYVAGDLETVRLQIQAMQALSTHVTSPVDGIDIAEFDVTDVESALEGLARHHQQEAESAARMLADEDSPMAEDAAYYKGRLDGARSAAMGARQLWLAVIRPEEEDIYD